MMASESKALVLWAPGHSEAATKIDQNARPEGGRWAVFFNAQKIPTPGRTLGRVYTNLGSMLEKRANRAAYKLGLGPHVITQKIKNYFGEGEERLTQLESLRSKVSPKLKKKCWKLMKYALPIESATTQTQAFKDIVDLVTLFPGLRFVLLHTKCFDEGTSADVISELWACSTGLPDDDWKFRQALAVTALVGGPISAIVEGSSISGLAVCEEGKLSVTEQLLVQHECSGTFSLNGALCLRYLAGILDLPGFWLEMGAIHLDVARRLFSEMTQVLKDIKVDFLALGPIDEIELPFDYDGVDFLATTILTGMSGWFAKPSLQEWINQAWYERFCIFLKLLRRPRAAELLPDAYSLATGSFEDILPTVYAEAELNIVVDINTTTPAPASHSSPHDDNVLTLEHNNQSISSIQNTIPEEAHPQQDTGEAQSHTSTEESVGQDRSDRSTLDDVAEFSEGIGNTFCDVQSDLDYNIRPVNIGTGSPELDANTERIAIAQGVQPATSYPSFEAKLKKLQDQKLALIEMQETLGDDHSETLYAMKNLAYTHYELGKCTEAKDLSVAVLEKERIFLGENHPDTLYTMGNLASTYQQLGQFKQAEQLAIVVLESRRKILAEDHPDTLWSMGNLASIYNTLGQFKQAEQLEIVLLEKQRKILGEDHLDTLSAMDGLASTYHSLGKFRQAEQLQNVVLEKRRKILGEDHPHTLWIMGCLASTYGDMGQFRQAEQLHIALLEKQRKILGGDHPDTLSAMDGLASTYRSLGQFRQAEQFQIDVLEKRRKILGEDHPQTLQAMQNLAWTYYELGQLTQAEVLGATAVTKHNKTFGNPHPDTRQAMINLAHIYHAVGKVQEAEELKVIIDEED
ncbi:hypothetical protein MVEN_00661900 [Mycena venus]|uniref:Kinesin light chain n=1 Tax=Mycena venus TaxID=2733690 RepID=A0A8H6YSF7_9AGAR|nr:hypothetical protein MVEN_00661900 [Mycena venus]